MVDTITIQLNDLPKDNHHLSEKVPQKVRKLVNEAGIDIPDSNIDRAHRIEPEKDKQTGIHRKTHNI